MGLRIGIVQERPSRPPHRPSPPATSSTHSGRRTPAASPLQRHAQRALQLFAGRPYPWRGKLRVIRGAPTQAPHPYHPAGRFLSLHVCRAGRKSTPPLKERTASSVQQSPSFPPAASEQLPHPAGFRRPPSKTTAAVSAARSRKEKAATNQKDPPSPAQIRRRSTRALRAPPPDRPPSPAYTEDSSVLLLRPPEHPCSSRCVARAAALSAPPKGESRRPLPYPARRNAARAGGGRSDPSPPSSRSSFCDRPRNPPAPHPPSPVAPLSRSTARSSTSTRAWRHPPLPPTFGGSNSGGTQAATVSQRSINTLSPPPSPPSRHPRSWPGAQTRSLPVPAHPRRLRRLPHHRLSEDRAGIHPPRNSAPDVDHLVVKLFFITGQPARRFAAIAEQSTTQSVRPKSKNATHQRGQLQLEATLHTRLDCPTALAQPVKQTCRVLLLLLSEPTGFHRRGGYWFGDQGGGSPRCKSISLP